MNFMPVRQIIEPAAQRAVGRLALGFARDGAPTRIKTFYQEGCLKSRLPRPVDAGICEAVLMNISGGVAGGDRLSTSIELEAGARVDIATQAAERIYRAIAAPAEIRTTIKLSPGACLNYLPQETILFDGFALNRGLEIELAADSVYLGVESLVFGRQAMGECITQGDLRDSISLRQSGTLLYQDMTKLHGNIHAQLQRGGLGNGAMAMASIIFASPQAAATLPALRESLAAQKITAGVSLLESVLVARLLAPTAAGLRAAIIAALSVCRCKRALPRVWQG